MLTLETVLPVTVLTIAAAPPPEVFVLSNTKLSPTLYPLPDSTTWKSSIVPLVTDSTTDTCFVSSLDSMIKSLSAVASETLYGKVFLIILELLKSKLS